MPDPIGEITGVKRRPTGISVGQMRVPLGVFGMIYESRPNVTIEAASLAIKSGNAAQAQDLANRFRTFFPEFDILFVDSRGQVLARRPASASDPDPAASARHAAKPPVTPWQVVVEVPTPDWPTARTGRHYRSCLRQSAAR